MNTQGPIPKGCVLVARKRDDSECAHAAPCTRELFDLAVRKANYRDQKCGRTTIRRGQWLTSYEEIQKLLHWRIGYRKLTYTRHQISAGMKYLRSHLMVTTAKATRGLFITVINYGFYQQLSNYENHNESHNENHSKATRQRSKGSKGSNTDGTFVPPTPTQVDEYAASIGYHRPDLGRDFCQKYDALDWHIKGGKKMDNWKLTVQTWRKTDERNSQGGDGSTPTLTPRGPTTEELVTAGCVTDGEVA